MVLNIICFFIFGITLILSQDQPGLRLGLTEEVIKQYGKEFLPKFIEKITTQGLKPIKANNSDPYFGTFYFILDDIKIDIPNKDLDNLDVYFNNDSTINSSLKIKEIKFSFNFTLQSEGYFNTNKGQISLSNVDIECILRLFSLKNIHSTNDTTIYGPGLNIISLNMSKFDIDLKFYGDSNIEKLLQLLFDNIKYNFIMDIQSILLFIKIILKMTFLY
jgi:hypothetical protein